jgi:HEAT repeat protein
VIDVDCTCGRTYSVPVAKAGRKLQCKRCGSVVRIPHSPQPSEDEGFLIPFQMPEEPGLEPLDLAEPARRCPSCGFTDDASVVICVHCGFDSRTGKRLADAHETAQESARLSSKQSASDAARDLERLGGLSLTPLGLLLGPYVLLRSSSVSSEGLGRSGAGRLARARYRALGGFLLWGAVLAVGMAIASRRSAREGDDLATICASRLQGSSKVILREIESEGSFPRPAGSLRRVLEALAERDPSLAPDDLRCPLSEGLYSYASRDGESLSAGVAPNYVVLWDSVAHSGPQGSDSWRALRFDGAVETFSSEEDLQKAIAREPFAHLDPGAKPKRSPQPGGSGSPVAVPPGARAELARFTALADECDRRDPFLEKALEVPEVVFTERTGVPPREYLPQLIKDKGLRRRAGRMLCRTELPRDQKRLLAEILIKDPDPVVRYAAAATLKRLGDPWVGHLLWVSEAGDEPLREAALRVVGNYAAEGESSTRIVLSEAKKMRLRAGATGDDAMFQLPAAALSHVTVLLTDPQLGAEARAVLYSAGKGGLKALRLALGNLDPKVRRAAFALGVRFVEDGALPLAEYLKAVQSEGDGQVQAEAIQPFVTRRLTPDLELTTWLLAFLRGDPADSARAAARRLLARVGTAPRPQNPGTSKQLVEDLVKEGDHEAVLSELASKFHVADASLDAQILRLWRRVGLPATRVRLVAIVENRPHEGSARALLEAISDDDEEVRTQALDGLVRGTAPLGTKLRRDAARAIAKRLRNEKGARARKFLFQLSQGYYVCGRYPAADRTAKHVCSTPLMNSLKSRVREGDRRALRCLGAHPSDQAFEALIELLGVGDVRLRTDVRSELAALTGLQQLPAQAGLWRREEKRNHDEIQRRFINRAETERRTLLERNRKAAVRVEDLKRR